MKYSFSRVLTALFTASLFACSAFAQNNSIASAAGDKYVISANAGGVNFVEGTVGVTKKEGKSGLLLKGDQLQIGDRVSTGTTGKVEILLNPGSFLRLGIGSSFEFKTTSLDDLQIDLESGSAILEVFAGEDFTVTVNAPKTKFHLIQSGIYRVDVAKDGSGTIAVWKGKAELSDANGSIVKGGREASVTNGNAAITKFDRSDKDALETWSKARSKELAKTSASLDRSQMRTSLISSFFGRRWNTYDSFGLWVFDPFGRNYCFLPFGYGWQSPYGYGFGNYLGWYNLPSIVYYPPTNNSRPGTVPATQTTTDRRTGSRTIDSGSNRNSERYPREEGVPPFVRMQGDSSSRVGVSERSPTFDNERGPVYSQPGSSQPIVSAPPVTVTSAPREIKHSRP